MWCSEHSVLVWKTGWILEILWVPSHSGVDGNDAAGCAARELPEMPGQLTKVPAFCVSEWANVIGRVREAVGREDMF
jgi:hypothetical protein